MSGKKSISVRLMVSDLRRIKNISRRIGVKESDIFRFSVKMAMNQLMPLLDNDVRGPGLLLAFVDCGEELLRYFEFDVQQLSKIINGNLTPEEGAVDLEDIRLLSIAGVNTNYLAIKLSEILGREVEPALACKYLRDYLFEKYQGEAGSHREAVLEAAVP